MFWKFGDFIDLDPAWIRIDQIGWIRIRIRSIRIHITINKFKLSILKSYVPQNSLKSQTWTNYSWPKWCSDVASVANLDPVFLGILIWKKSGSGSLVPLLWICIIFMWIRIRGSASEKKWSGSADPHRKKTDPDPRICIGKKRIRIQLLVNDFCEFYFPFYVFTSFYFHFLNRLILYIINLINNYKKRIFCALYFGCPLCYRDPIRIRFLHHDADADPDLAKEARFRFSKSGAVDPVLVKMELYPQHWLYQILIWRISSKNICQIGTGYAVQPQLKGEFHVYFDDSFMCQES